MSRCCIHAVSGALAVYTLFFEQNKTELCWAPRLLGAIFGPYTRGHHARIPSFIGMAVSIHG